MPNAGWSSRLRSSSIAFVLFMVCPLASATGLEVLVTDLGSPAPGLAAYSVALTLPGEFIIAWDIEIQGSLHQVAWQPQSPIGRPPVLTPSVEDWDGLGSLERPLDSHFLMRPDIVLVPPEEDNDLSGGLGSPGFAYGWGTYMRMVGAFVGVGVEALDVAQIVLPEGSAAHVTGVVAGPMGEEFPVGFVVPEPSGLLLLAAGSLAMFRRRRGLGRPGHAIAKRHF